MKKLFIASVIAALSFQSVAEETTKTEREELCQSVYELAESVMTGRQTGVSIIQAKKVSNGNQLMDFLIKDAYSQRLRHTEELQQTVIQEFANDHYLGCYDQFVSEK